MLRSLRSYRKMLPNYVIYIKAYTRQVLESTYEGTIVMNALFCIYFYIFKNYKRGPVVCNLLFIFSAHFVVVLLIYLRGKPLCDLHGTYLLAIFLP